VGISSRALKAAVVGWPAVGWPPPMGYTGKSITDVTVNATTAMTIGAWHAGVRLIAEDIGSLPLHLFEKVGKARIEAPDHPSYPALAVMPNPEMTAMVWRETMVGHYLTWGNCYSEKEFNGQGQVVRLWPLRPDRVRVARETDTQRRVYLYTTFKGEEVPLPARNVFHVPGFGYDGLIGYSRLAMARRTLENAIAVEEFGLYTFANGAQPGVIIKHPGQLSPTAKLSLKTSWEEQHKGLSNAQRTAILDEGMSIEEVGFPPEDAQYISAKQATVEEIARWLRLAPHKLSDMSRATFSNIEESNIDYVVGTLTPPLVRFEQQIDKDVLDAGRYYVKHNAAALMRGNSKDRAAFYQTMRQNGLLTDDEIRAFEDLNPLSEEDRQHVLWPLNSVPASAFDANGMTFQNRVESVGVLVRAGFEPAAALVALGVPAVPHTGLVPVTVTLDPLAGAAPKSTAPEARDVEAISGLRAAIRSLAEPPPAPIVNVAPPVVNVPAPLVTVQAPDLSEIADGLEAITARLDASVTKTLLRDPVTQAIVGVSEIRNGRTRKGTARGQ